MPYFVQLYTDFVRQPVDGEVSLEVESDSKSRYFAGCVGRIDGTPPRERSEFPKDTDRAPLHVFSDTFFMGRSKDPFSMEIRAAFKNYRTPPGPFQKCTRPSNYRNVLEARLL